MRRRSLAKMRWKRVKLLPAARRVDFNGLELPRIDDVWMIRDASTRELEIFNPRTHHFVRFGTANVREHMPDDRTDGILKLRIQVVLSARGLSVYPLSTQASLAPFERFFSRGRT